jgi:hypothetical protein
MIPPATTRLPKAAIVLTDVMPGEIRPQDILTCIDCNLKVAGWAIWTTTQLLFINYFSRAPDYTNGVT